MKRRFDLMDSELRELDEDLRDLEAEVARDAGSLEARVRRLGTHTLAGEIADGMVVVNGVRGFSITCEVCGGSYFSQVKSEHQVDGQFLVLCPDCQKAVAS